MLCAIRRVSDPSVIELPRRGPAGLRRSVASRLEGFSAKCFEPKPLHPFNNGFVGAFSVESHPLVRQADLLQLYWVAAGFLSVSAIGQLLRLGKPVVWRLSDMWAFTGGCHYPIDCTRYREHCGSCPQLGRSWPYDVSRINHELKRHAYARAPLTIVTPSQLLANACRQSSLLPHARIENIPTGIDLTAFSPRPRAEARRHFNLPEHGKIVLFGARGGLSDPRKGGEFGLEAVRRLSNTQDVCFAVFGAEEPQLGDLGNARSLGMLRDEESLALAYSAADVYLSPCLQDNLPNTVLESIACGCPVVGFRDSGIEDAVRDNESGFLVERGDSAGLAEQCHRILTESALSERLRSSARQLAEREFDQDIQARRYLSLYRELLS